MNNKTPAYAAIRQQSVTPCGVSLHSSPLTPHSTTYWNTFADFLAMGKHGVYVWGSFVVMALVMIVEPILIVRSRRQLAERLRRQYRAEQLERETDAGGEP